MPEIKNFKCKECGVEVELIYLPNILPETFQEFNKRLSEEKCSRCAYAGRYM